MCVQNQWAFLKVEMLNGFKWSITRRVKGPLCTRNCMNSWDMTGMHCTGGGGGGGLSLKWLNAESIDISSNEISEPLVLKLSAKSVPPCANKFMHGVSTNSPMTTTTPAISWPCQWIH